jgi:hypothetical protein
MADGGEEDDGTRECLDLWEIIAKRVNTFFRPGHGSFGDLMDAWIRHPQAQKRMFGITRAASHALDPAGKQAARGNAQDQREERLGVIFQRRHDCIHNGDRPKVAPQLREHSGTVLKVIEDIEFLVLGCDEHINIEFRQFPLNHGCPAGIIAQAGYSSRIRLASSDPRSWPVGPSMATIQA